MEAFLSYSNSSQHIAKALDRALRERGVVTWFDEWRLQPGQSSVKHLESALRNTQAIVFLVDPSWKDQPSLQYEWSAALEAAWKDPKKRLIPVLIEGAETPAFLRDLAAVRVGKRQSNLDPVARRIVTALRTGKTSTKTPGLARERARWRNRLREIKTEVAALRS